MNYRVFAIILSFILSNVPNVLASEASELEAENVSTKSEVKRFSFFVEGSMMNVDSGLQLYGVDDPDENSYAGNQLIENESSTGERVGLGYNLAADKKLQIAYFRYRSDNSDSTSLSGLATYTLPYNLIYYTSASSRVEHKVDSLDIDLITTKARDKNLSVQITGGLKYADYNRDFASTYFGEDFASAGDTIYTNSYFKAFGPKLGAEADYSLTEGLSFFGGGSVALVAGSSHIKRNYDSSSNLASFKISKNLVTPIIAGDFGIKMTKHDVIGNSSWVLKLGYSIETWQSVVGDVFYADDITLALNTNYSDLVLAGAYVRASISF